MFWQSENQVCLYGDRGTLQLTPRQGQLYAGETSRVIEVQTRQGSFRRDSEAVLDYLWDGKPLYTTPAASLYALNVAAAAEQSAITGQQQNLNEQ